MELSTQWMEYAADGATVAAYRTRAARSSERLPAVIVIHEVWGADAHIRDVADRLAAGGYLALAPDLHSRGGRSARLAPERIDCANSDSRTGVARG